MVFQHTAFFRITANHHLADIYSVKDRRFKSEFLPEHRNRVHREVINSLYSDRWFLDMWPCWCWSPFLTMNGLSMDSVSMFRFIALTTLIWNTCPWLYMTVEFGISVSFISTNYLFIWYLYRVSLVIIFALLNCIFPVFFVCEALWIALVYETVLHK